MFECNPLSEQKETGRAYAQNLSFSKLVTAVNSRSALTRGLFTYTTHTKGPVMPISMGQVTCSVYMKGLVQPSKFIFFLSGHLAISVWLPVENFSR